MSIFKQPLIQNPPPNLQRRDNKSSRDGGGDNYDNDWNDNSGDDSSDGGDGGD